MLNYELSLLGWFYLFSIFSCPLSGIIIWRFAATSFCVWVLNLCLKSASPVEQQAGAAALKKSVLPKSVSSSLWARKQVLKQAKVWSVTTHQRTQSAQRTLPWTALPSPFSCLLQHPWESHHEHLCMRREREKGCKTYLLWFNLELFELILREGKVVLIILRILLPSHFFQQPDSWRK